MVLPSLQHWFPTTVPLNFWSVLPNFRNAKNKNYFALYLISKHSEESINSFWTNIWCDYPIIAKKALNILLPFCTSYLCEFGFSALTNIKTKKRSRLLNIDDEMRVALSFLRPNINEIIKNHQAQISH